MVNTFDRHDFSFKWSYAEMAPLIVGLGYDWVIEQVTKCIKELVELTRPGSVNDNAPLFTNGKPDSFTPPPIDVTCKSADSLDHLANG